MNEQKNKALTYLAVSYRIIMMEFETELVLVNIIAPTSKATEEEVEVTRLFEIE